MSLIPIGDHRNPLFIHSVCIHFHFKAEAEATEPEHNTRNEKN